MFRKKEIQQKPKLHPKGEVEHIDMPIRVPIRNYNLMDILRYFKYNFSAPMLFATIERGIIDGIADRESFPIKTISIIMTIAIAVFVVFMGAVILMNSVPAVAPAVAAPVGLTG